ncbi:AAA family ATPase [Maritimibacter sp. HL-12]|jgi:pilus assembly protein CpaE|uniref:AAA family ATPase n=1 Tax=Maritimibacter sp. HL-12 TaxID=1162418 RepID=UPI000A0F140D|nr:AAA family ATPase [Maritimibacter sp. HL-12]SMH37779.1 pilus assembly protein CpaE [Maritimibacter sp. HL-12]
MKHAAIPVNEDAAATPSQAASSVRVPHLTAAAFCLTAATRGAIERASSDRRLTRVKTEVNDGGIDRLRRSFATRQTPSLLVVEVSTTGEELLKELDALAEICDPETKVVVIGAENDIGLYRTLMKRGVAEYLVGAITPLAYVATIQKLFGQESATQLGKVYVFVGAKGGVGASTLAQNVAWTLAEERSSPTLLLDLDFRFGSAAVNLDLKPVTGLEKYLAAPDKLDAALLDRLVVQRGEFLSVLPGFDDALGDIEPAPEAVERLIEIARASFPHVVVDLPHDWSPGSRDALTSADEVIVVAAPDLPNLRNVRALLERLRALRPNDAPPRVILNGCRVPRRKEIAPDKFAKSIGLETCPTITFDPVTFGAAAAEGRALREHAPRSKAQGSVRHLAQSLSGQSKARPRGPLRLLLGLR